MPLGPGFPPSPPHAGHFKGAAGEASPAGRLSLLPPELPLEVEKHLENPMESGVWNLAPRGALGMGASGAALPHVLCLEPELIMGQFFKSEPFKPSSTTPSPSLVGGRMSPNSPN